MSINGGLAYMKNGIWTLRQARQPPETPWGEKIPK